MHAAMRTGPDGGRSENHAAGGDSAASLPLLHEMSHRARDIALAYYASGYTAGLAEGRRLAEAEMDAAWSSVAEKVRALGSPQSVPFSRLCELRGQHERAARARVAESRVMYG